MTYRLAGQSGSFDGNVAGASSPSPANSNAAKLVAVPGPMRPMLAQVDLAGVVQALAPHPSIARPEVYYPLQTAAGGFNTNQALGSSLANVGTVGTATVAGALAPIPIVQEASAAVAGSLAVWAQAFANHVYGNGFGLYALLEFAVTDALGSVSNMFIGLRNSTAAPTDVDASTLTNLIGIGITNGDANLQVYGAGAVAQPRTSLGANFPIPAATDVYRLEIYGPKSLAAPTPAPSYQLTRLATGAVVQGRFTNFPAAGTSLGWSMWRSNAGIAVTSKISLAYAYVDRSP